MSNPLLATRREGLIEAEVDGEIVALHVETGTCYGFNQTATRIWSLLEQPKTLAQLCAALGDEFDVDPDQCEGDVEALLRELSDDNLVTLSNDAAPAG